VIRHLENRNATLDEGQLNWYYCGKG